MTGRILIDTGPLVAIFSNRDDQHEICCQVLRDLRSPLLTCWPVITEAAWLLRSNPSDVRRLLKSIGDGFLQLLSIDKSGIEAVIRILHKYEDRGAQLADMCLLYLAEREQVKTIFTLDRRDFGIYRIKGNRRLRLLPES
jgi:predicted nucleic acid-binding protein